MTQGTVKWFNVTKGFGFIAPDGGGSDVFVHLSSVIDGGSERGLSDNQRVEFEIVEGAKGKQADSVRGL